MNEITILFCYVPLALALLGPVLTILSVMERGKAARNKSHAAERVLEIREADAHRRNQLHEARLAKENNAVILQDLKIEIERLKLEAALKELTPPDFQTSEYTSDRQPFTPPVS